MEDFLKQLVEELQRCMDSTGDEYFISLHDICKNNDMVLHSIVIRKAGEQISKNIYAESYFEMNMRGTPVEEIAQSVIALYNDKSYEQQLEENMIDLIDYDAVKERLILRLVSRELNDNFLADKLFVDMEDTDLVAVFYVLISKDISGLASVAVTGNYAKQWEVRDVNELFKVALGNTEKIFPAYSNY